MCFWGRQTDATYLGNVALLVLTGFDSAVLKRLCLEHFSYSPNPTPVESCFQLVDYLKNLLTTYDELWGLDWKEHLYPVMEQYFENFETTNNGLLD